MTEKAKRFHQGCRIGCWLIVIIQLAFLLLQWSSLPDQIPAHYDAAGNINRWGSKTELLFLPCLSAAMIAGLEWVSRHPKLWNIPAEVTEKNREALEALTLKILSILELLVILGFALLEFFNILHQPLPALLMVGFVVMVMSLILAAIIRLQRTAEKYR